MEKVNHDVLERQIKRCFEVQFPLFIFGGFGIGKSYTVRRVAEKMAGKRGRKFIDWNQTSLETKKEIIEDPEPYFVLKDTRLSQLDPSDINGIPDIATDAEYLEWRPPTWAVWASREEAAGFLFFDEANLASPSVMKAFYQVVHDREIGDIPVSDKVGIVSAGNRMKDRAGVHKMPKPLSDRYFEVELEVPSIEEWQEWAIEHEIDPHIVAFLNLERGALYMPREDESKFKPATPRGWEQVSRFLAPIGQESGADYREFVRTSIASRLGEDIASDFVGFLKLREKISIRDFIERPSRAKIPEESDLKWLVICGLSNWYRGVNDEEKLDALKTCLTVGERFKHDDFALCFSHQIKYADKDFWNDHVNDVQSWTKSKGLGERIADFLSGDFHA